MPPGFSLLFSRLPRPPLKVGFISNDLIQVRNPLQRQGHNFGVGSLARKHGIRQKCRDVDRRFRYPGLPGKPVPRDRASDIQS